MIVAASRDFCGRVSAAIQRHLVPKSRAHQEHVLSRIASALAPRERVPQGVDRPSREGKVGGPFAPPARTGMHPIPESQPAIHGPLAHAERRAKVSDAP